MCIVCDRIRMIKEGKNPYFVKELETGYVVMGDHQHFKGYALLLYKEHVRELHELQPEIRNKFLEEMALTGEAVFRAFAPEKMNYELLGNGDVHMHWHLFPRRSGDTPKAGPVWKLPTEEMHADSNRPSAEELEDMKKRLGQELDRLSGHV